jgi:hypothetical protein
MISRVIATALGGIAIGAVALMTAPAYADTPSGHGPAPRIQPVAATHGQSSRPNTDSRSWTSNKDGQSHDGHQSQGPNHHGDQNQNHHSSHDTNASKWRNDRNSGSEHTWATRIVGFEATPSRVHKGDRLFLHGKVRSQSGHGYQLGRRRVDVYFRPNGSGDSRRIDTITTRSDGTFSTQARATKSGTWSVSVDGGRRGGSKAYDYVTVVG